MQLLYISKNLHNIILIFNFVDKKRSVYVSRLITEIALHRVDIQNTIIHSIFRDVSDELHLFQLLKICCVLCSATMRDG